MRATYADAFDLHQGIGDEIERAILRSRAFGDELGLVLDMLMVQGYKSHTSVSLLCQHGLMEDAATIARRLLELSVQAVYIGAESNQAERLRRAGRYLAFLWRQLPPNLKHRLPAPIRTQWSRIARRYGRLVSARARSWGPNWRDMFKAIGHERTYLRDYTLLSAIAHGSPQDQIATYSQPTVRIQSQASTSTLLVFATGYYVAIAEQWAGHFGLLAQDSILQMTKKVVCARSRRGAT